MTLSESDFLKQALADIEAVKSEAELLAWDEWASAQPEYLQIPESAVRQLEDAYVRKLQEVTGWGTA